MSTSTSKKYIFSRFEFSEKYRDEVIELARRNCNIELGGYRMYDGTGTHYMQNPVEITDFVMNAKKQEARAGRKFDSFLEVGYSLGINNTFVHKFFNFSNVVAVDFVAGAGSASSTFVANLRFKNMSLICGDSTDERTIEKVKKFGGYDVIFIDGGHDYKTVTQDYKNYSPMLNPGGVIAFHDIKNPDYPGISQFWAEIRERDGDQWDFVDLVDTGQYYTYGIGILFPKKR